MNKFWRIALIVVGASYLTACGSFEGQGHVDELNAKKLDGKSFDMHLAKEYRDLANFEWNKMLDYKDGNNYAEKGLDASAHKLVLPEDPKDWNLPDDEKKEIYSAHRKLLEFLTADAGSKMPHQAALAQTKFDCWVEQQHENWQFKDIAKCREGFYDALNELKKNVDITYRYMIFFKMDSIHLNSRDKAKLDIVIEDMDRGYLDTIHIKGHTDTVASMKYNDKLSLKRAEVLKDYMVSKGVKADRISVEGVGEKSQLVKTGQEVATMKNRRAVIHFVE